MVPTVIGALVGGLTNLLAIKMLFHPFAAIYIGKWKLPFTPGLIPRRREEIAVKLGEMVVNHLITADGLKKKLNDPELAVLMTGRIRQYLQNHLDGTTKIRQFMGGYSDGGLTESYVGQLIKGVISSRLHNYFLENSDKPLKEMLPRDILNHMEHRIPDASDFFVQEAVRYLESSDGIEKIERGITHFITRRGMWGELFLRMIGNQNILKHVYPEIISSIQAPDFRQALQESLEVKWTELKNEKVEKLLDLMGTDSRRAAGLIGTFLFSRKILDFTLDEIPGDLQSRLMEQFLPMAVSKGLSILAERTGPVLKDLSLEKMVAHQVSTFSLSELEQLIFSISKKELSMIANLGYLLGGIIGLLQGLLFLL